MPRPTLSQLRKRVEEARKRVCLEHRGTVYTISDLRFAEEVEADPAYAKASAAHTDALARRNRRDMRKTQSEMMEARARALDWIMKDEMLLAKKIPGYRPFVDAAFLSLLNAHEPDDDPADAPDAFDATPQE